MNARLLRCVAGLALGVVASGCLDFRRNYQFASDGGPTDAGIADTCSVSCFAPAPVCRTAQVLVTSRVRGCAGAICQLELTETTCTNGCAQGACVGEPCAGVVCEAPPPAKCVDANTLEFAETPGTCRDGVCGFHTARTVCSQGCANGTCTGELCAGKRCTLPPPSSCRDASTLRAYDATGSCDAQSGACTYTPHDTPCAQGCVNGACVNDPCAGVSCTTAPAATCESTTALKTWATPGTCTNGACAYAATTTTCAQDRVCQAGACVVQAPSCTAANCTGCCADGVCVPVSAQTGSQCGRDANVCGACGVGFTCTLGACTDLDECATNHGGCDAHATCTNTPGGRTCVCDVGYQGNGVTCAVIKEPNWVKASPAHRPAARVGAAMAYDSKRHVTVLFGGYGAAGSFADTWEYDGVDWVNRSLTGPTKRSGVRLAYDSLRAVMVLFGGSDTAFDTWAYDGTAWVNRAPAHHPPARGYHGLAFDSARGVTVVFGGTFLDDTWEFDGTDWAQRAVTGPPYRSTTMAYDPVRHQAVIYGGEGDEIYGDTWAWSGTEWAQVDQGGSGPPLMDEMAMAFDSARGKLVMFGGRDDLNYDLNEQWEWNGSQWRSVAPHGAAWPTERSGASMVFDSARGCLVMFGGGVFTASASTFLAETWEYCPPP